MAMAQIQQLPDSLPSSSSPCAGLAVQALPCRVLHCWKAQSKEMPNSTAHGVLQVTPVHVRPSKHSVTHPGLSLSPACLQGE